MKKTLLFMLSIAAMVAVSCGEDDPYEGRDAALVSFAFNAADNAGALLADCEGVITGNSVAVQVPYGTRVKNLKAVFTVADEESVVKVAETVQESGVTANDFSAPVDYVVSLGESKNAMYTVTVTYLPAAQWSAAPEVGHIVAGDLAMEINPSTGKPVIAVVENVGSSRGPLKVFNGDVTATPVTVSPEGMTCQYVGVGVADNGAIAVYTNEYQSATADRKGYVFTSADGKAWTRQDVLIDYSNGYYGHTVGCIGDEIYVMTSNNAAGAVAKRDANVTFFNGTTWSTGNVLCNRPSSNTYFPVMRIKGDAMYVLVLNVASTTQVGISIYKYQNKAWSEVVTLDPTTEFMANYINQVYDEPDMAIADDGTIYIGMGTNTPYKNAVIKIDPSSKEPSLVASSISLSSSIPARYCRIALDPLGRLHFAYRDDDSKLWATTLNEETYEWNAAALVCDQAVDDVVMRFNAKGEGFIVCSTSDVKDFEGNVTNPAHINLYTLK